jgi:hypothetical protein
MGVADSRARGPRKLLGSAVQELIGAPTLFVAAATKIVERIAVVVRLLKD